MFGRRPVEVVRVGRIIGVFCSDTCRLIGLGMVHGVGAGARLEVHSLEGPEVRRLR
jgi:hypothetical protein